MCTLVCQTASWILCCLCLRFLVFAWTHNDSRAQVCFICVAVTRLCLTVSDMRHVWCWHREYGTDWFTQGRCEAPGIHVDSFCPDIMHLPRLQSSHCTYCMSLAKKKKKLQVQIKQDNYLVWCHRADDFFSAPASQLQQNIWHMNRMKPVSLLMARRTQTVWNWLQKITFLSPIQKLILDIRNSSW